MLPTLEKHKSANFMKEDSDLSDGKSDFSLSGADLLPLTVEYFKIKPN